MKICVTGATGRMGNAIIDCISHDESNVQLSSALVKHQNDKCGTLVCDLHRAVDKNIKFSSDTKSCFTESDIIIDFTSPDNIKHFLTEAELCNKPIVIGTTGLRKQDFDLINDAARKIPVLQSNNTSLGINLLSAILEKFSSLITDDFDVEIYEMHHRHKKDHPSGTALLLGQSIASSIGTTLDELAVFNREKNKVRSKNEIGFSSSRGGGVYGDHDVIFASNEEMIKFHHRAISRNVFANGAIKAAKWLINKPNGLYSMKDILSI